MSKYSPQELQLIKKEISTLFNSNSHWKCVGYRRKKKNGKLTGDVAITLLVDEKLPLDQVDSNNLFPESINIPGISESVKTDVQEECTEFTLNVGGPTPPCYDIGTDGLPERPAHALSASWDPWDAESNWVMPVSGNRSTHRPLVGGISCSIFPLSGYDTPFSQSDLSPLHNTGTLGALCIDLDDNTVVGITNNHVIGGSLCRGNVTFWDDDTLEYDAVSAYTSTYGLTYWSPLSANDTISAPGETRYPVYQRGGTDAYTTSKDGLDSLKIGTVKRAFPYTVSNNKIDAAIFALDPSVSNLFSKTESWKQYQLARQDEDMADSVQGLSAMGFATTAEIDSLAAGEANEGAPVFRSGRTMGPVGWPGSKLHIPNPSRPGRLVDPPGDTGTCWISAYDVMASHTLKMGGNTGGHYIDGVEYNRFGWSESIFISGGADPSTGGDSGSFVYALFNEGNSSLSAWKVIGLLFGASGSYDRNQYGILNRIDNIAEMMNLSAYRGEDLDIGYKNTDIQVIDSRQSAVTAMIGGKLYWQVGSTNSPATRVFDT